MEISIHTLIEKIDELGMSLRQCGRTTSTASRYLYILFEIMDIERSRLERRNRKRSRNRMKGKLRGL